MSKKILLVGAMEKELRFLLEALPAQSKHKILNTYPFFTAQLNNLIIGAVTTFVGDTNAAVASTAAIQQFDPDYVFKVGCVGGNSEGLHKGDLLIPKGFFHSAAWITCSQHNNEPTKNAALWQSAFGKKPYQVSQENLGGIPHFFTPDPHVTSLYKDFLNQNQIKYVEGYIGGGNMWFFDKQFMQHVANTYLPKGETHWGADMESFALAHVCHVHKKPFSGFYLISNSDYYDEPYIPGEIANIFEKQLGKVVLGVLNMLT